MLDQATELRKLVLRSMRERPQAGGPPPRLVAFVGGKGGVGVSSIAVNMAVALAQQGARVVAVDADPNRSDIAHLCGVTDPNKAGESTLVPRDVHEALQPGPAGIQVVPGLGDGTALGDFGHERLLRQLQSLGRHAELVLLDIGSGASELTRRFCTAASDVVIVTTPDSVAVMDTYARIKTSLADLPDPRLWLIVNQAATEEEARDVYQRIEQSCKRFLQQRTHLLGHLLPDSRVADSTAAGTPLVLSAMESPIALSVHQMATQLLLDNHGQSRAA